MITRFSLRPYPEDFPCFNREGYAMDLDMGLIRNVSDVLTSVQRRSYSNLPTMISATIQVSVNKLHEFSLWLNENVGLWVNLPLAHPFLTLNKLEENVPARIVNFSFLESYEDFGTVKGTATIQLSPTVFIDNIITGDPYEWIIAGREPAPSLDWTIARRVTNPATQWVIAGGATHPGGP